MKKAFLKIWKCRGLRIMIIIILSVAWIWTVFAIIPPAKAMADNPFIVDKGKGPMIAAHRGGKKLNPENTFLAFDDAINRFHIEMLELDLVLTKDNRLVVIHNLSINAVSDVELVTGSNAEYLVGDHSLSELRLFNYGYAFKDKNNNRPYENLVAPLQADRREVIAANRLQIATIDEVFDAYYNLDLLFSVEIKNGGETGKKACDVLNSILNDTKRYPGTDLVNRVVVGTFHDEIEAYLKTTYPKLLRGGSVGEVTKFVLTQMLGVNLLDNSNFVCLQIPTSRKAFNINIKLDKKTYINRAHRRNISVQYWTINDEATMRHLIELGVDVIMTDDPELLYHVLKDMGYRD
ncbi:MAG TPA: glycerophosphodiester phosphodiesterase family protein [Bacilli bacterium]|nr:MAG: putative glycerophosphoryl diester phosphodiesterase 1 [Tenericutes bacterium ADurb.BinA124]HPN60500.1 glycerophosphodiester phosphodiesterase family protein [Bacilli bacterium]HPX83999.1 glycerophosphodiester phosphodiesterase family protein [Bacilli bacterium]HQC74099.1 glycerophosphodiester phosphodiesterase family protein [Bacilli bacterium]